jgi:hypothetical protein
MLLVAMQDGRRRHGLWKVPARAGILGTMSPLNDKPSDPAVSPTALTVSEQGYILAAESSSRGGIHQLVFLNPTNGQLILRLPTALREITGLAYSPKSGNLFALAAANTKGEQGLFRIDDASKPGQPGAVEVKLAEIERPSALAFGPDGVLYVTTFGDEDEDKGGALLKVTGDL